MSTSSILVLLVAGSVLCAIAYCMLRAAPNQPHDPAHVQQDTDPGTRLRALYNSFRAVPESGQSQARFSADSHRPPL